MNGGGTIRRLLCGVRSRAVGCALQGYAADMTSHAERSPVAGALAGAVAGMAGAWVMDRAQSLLSRAIGDNPSDARDDWTDSQGGQRARAYVQRGEASEPATMVATAKLSRVLTGAMPSKSQRWWGGVGLHYAFGAGVGALYGAIAEGAPVVTRAAGLPYGTAVWLAAENVMAPAMGVSPPPTRSSPRLHLHALFAHLAFGFATETVRRVLRPRHR
jgi:putative membrane protein